MTSTHQLNGADSGRGEGAGAARCMVCQGTDGDHEAAKPLQTKRFAAIPGDTHQSRDPFCGRQTVSAKESVLGFPPQLQQEIAAHAAEVKKTIFLAGHERWAPLARPLPRANSRTPPSQTGGYEHESYPPAADRR